MLLKFSFGAPLSMKVEDDEMADTSDDKLLTNAGAGDQNAAAALFSRHRDRLRRMVRLRLDRSLQARLDPSDVLQDVYIEFAKSVAAYAQQPEAPLFLWLRMLTERKLHYLHRTHLGTKQRDTRREVSLHRGSLPQASSAMLAARLLGKFTSPSIAAMRLELKIRIEEALNRMEVMDREVLALRHYEQLTNAETAKTLGISEAAASARFVRALRRLKDILAGVPGIVDSGTNREAK
jgi:RNA polymerase sigma-70 factor (ECF subfamily)